MPARLLLWCCLIATAILCFAPRGAAEDASSKPIILWPEGAPGARSIEDADNPTLTPFLAPPDKATGAAIILCPGGGYHHLAKEHGQPVGQLSLSVSHPALVNPPTKSDASCLPESKFCPAVLVY